MAVLGRRLNSRKYRESKEEISKVPTQWSQVCQEVVFCALEEEDQGKVIGRGQGHGLHGGSPEPLGQFLECHFALFAWDNLLG